jgi:hypothetical protein
MRGKITAFMALILMLFNFVIFPGVLAADQQTEKKTEEKVLTPEPTEEKIIAAPSSLKEKTGIYVFLAWLWISIVVLVFLLRLKIKEADRLYQLKYFSDPKK